MAIETQTSVKPEFFMHVVKPLGEQACLVSLLFSQKGSSGPAVNLPCSLFIQMNLVIVYVLLLDFPRSM